VSGQSSVGKLSRTESLAVPPKATPVVSLLAALVPPTETQPERFLGCRIDPDTGRLLVDTGGGGGPVIVEGTYEPSDTQANPDDLVGVESFNMAWNVVSSQWARWPADEFNIPYVHISSGILTQDGGVAYDGNFLTGQTQNLNQHRVRGTADWWLTRGGYVAAVPTTDLPGIVNSLPIGIHNTVTPALTNGQGLALQLSSRGALKTEFDQPTRAFGNPFTVSSTGGGTVLAPGEYPSTVTLPYHSIRCGPVGAWDTGGFIGTISAAEKDSLRNELCAAGYNDTAPVPVDGGAVALQVDRNSNLLTQLGRPRPSLRAAPSLYHNNDITAEVIQGSIANLLSISVSSEEASQVLWFQIFNDNATPTNSDIPVAEFWLGSLAEPGSNVLIIGRDFFSEAGICMTTGLAWAVSTSKGSLTLPASFDGAVTATYV